MSNTRPPLVSIITPVLNGRPYIAECVESVLAQSYPDWEYIVVDNCSTDGTDDLIRDYAASEPRIRMHRNAQRVNAAANHNIGLSLISAGSRYSKFVHADDWLYPDCVRKMVELAEAHPRVGIVGAYGRSGADVRWTGLPEHTAVVPGREICRRSLMGGFYVFGSPTSLLFRSDLAAGKKEFFDSVSPYPAFVDQEAVYRELKTWDFGFVHEVLTYTRVHKESATSRSLRTALNTDLAAGLYILSRYGPAYLTSEEYRRRLDRLLERYYRFLGANLVRLRRPDFRRYHTAALERTGHSIQWARIVNSYLTQAAGVLSSPSRMLAKARRGVRKAGRQRLLTAEAQRHRGRSFKA